MQNPNARIVALDVGHKRIGVASANVVARLANPLTTLEVKDDINQQISSLLSRETACALVVGLPRNLQSQETTQTKFVRKFIDDLRQQLTIPVYWQDEALTSQVSEAELKIANKVYQKGDIDALAAAHILEDFLAEHKELPS